MATMRVSRARTTKFIPWFTNAFPYVDEEGNTRVIGDYVRNKWSDIKLTKVGGTDNTEEWEITGSRQTLQEWVDEHDVVGSPLYYRKQYELANKIAVLVSRIDD